MIIHYDSETSTNTSLRDLSKQQSLHSTRLKAPMSLWLGSIGIIIILGFIIFFILREQSDEKKIIGKWQSDRDWFQFKEDKTYSSGKDMIKMVDHFIYTIDSKNKELNLYTDDKNSTYYLKYQFISNDTLGVRNVMSSNTTLVKFYKVKDNKD